MFRKNHPYLFWQLIGWGVILLDAGVAVLGALNDAGEWIYPVVVFTFIAGIALVVTTPILVWLKRKNMLPDSADDNEKRLLQSRIMQIESVRNARGLRGALMVILAILLILGPFFLAYILGEYVHIALGVLSLGLSFACPFMLIAISSTRTIKRFYKVEHGEKRFDFTEPSDLDRLCASEAITLILPKKPTAATLNFLYNWLGDYLYGRRISAHLLPVSELPLNLSVIDEIFGEDFCGQFFLCIPLENLRNPAELGDLAERFLRECGAVGAFPLNYLVEQNKFPAEIL